MTNQYFKYKKLNKEKLITFGFTRQNDNYKYETQILDGQFRVIIEIDSHEHINTKVLDVLTNEPYTLHLVEGASGTFVGSVKNEFERILSDIAEKCFEKDVFKSNQAHEVIKYISEKYGDELEFLWEKFPQDAIWRRKDNNKWYAILLVIPKRKLGIVSDELIDVIDLRAESNEIDNIVDNEKIFYGYHMNKKHWITIPLTDLLPIEKIYEYIDKSYILAKK